MWVKSPDWVKVQFAGVLLMASTAVPLLLTLMVLPLRLSVPVVKVACHVPPSEPGTVHTCVEPLRAAVLPFNVQSRLQPLAAMVVTSDDEKESMLTVPVS